MELITLSSAAALCDLSLQRFLAQYVHNGKLATIREKKGVFVSKADLLAITTAGDPPQPQLDFTTPAPIEVVDPAVEPLAPELKPMMESLLRGLEELSANTRYSTYQQYRKTVQELEDVRYENSKLLKKIDRLTEEVEGLEYQSRRGLFRRLFNWL